MIAALTTLGVVFHVLAAPLVLGAVALGLYVWTWMTLAFAFAVLSFLPVGRARRAHLKELSESSFDRLGL